MTGTIYYIYIKIKLKHFSTTKVQLFPLQSADGFVQPSVINIKWNKILMLYICRSGDIEEYKRKYEEELEKWKQELEKVEKDAAKDKIEKDRLEKETKHVR